MHNRSGKIFDLIVYGADFLFDIYQVGNDVNNAFMDKLEENLVI